MKCIHCQRDSKYKERTSGRCPGCQHRFAFEPRKGDPMTDGVFDAALERVSAGGSVRFNTDHLYYEVRRRYLHPIPSVARAFRFAGVAIFVALLFHSAWMALVLLGTIAGVYAWLRARRRVPWRRFPRTDFDKLLRRYVQAHGALQGLIERRPRAAQPQIDPQEMLAYSFDRAVICDRPEAVDMLIANQFHFENNCAVLSIDGYPPHAFETVRAMLRNNPRLVVVALHDASVAGCQLAHRLRNDPAWFKDGVAVLDVGLSPLHHQLLRGQHERVRPHCEVEAGMGISNEEAAWLSRNTLALAVVIPEQIIKRLFRAISLVEEHYEDAPSGSRDDVDLEFGLDADSSDGGGGSFG